VLEAAELVRLWKEEWGVSAAAPVAVAAVAGNGGAAAEAAEEKTEFDVIIKDAVPRRSKSSKPIRQITNLGLVEAKAMAETAGSKVLEQVGKKLPPMQNPNWKLPAQWSN
jgi:large subunit ribosomal protein L7/L12